MPSKRTAPGNILILVIVGINLFPFITNAATFNRTLSLGMSGDEVKALQTYLKTNGFLVGYKATGYFGVGTFDAVRKYQATNGLDQVGVVGPKTRALLNGSSAATQTSATLITRTLALGTSGADVNRLQEFLKTQGFYSYPTITGYFGPLTEAALKAFQSAKGLEPVGQAGPKTRALIAQQQEVAATGSTPTTQSAPPTTQPRALSTGATHSGGGGGSGGGGNSNPAPDITAPTISNILPGTPGQTSTTVTWITDEAADSQVAYGTNTGYGATTTLDTSLVTSHSVILSALSPNTTYHFRVRTADASGNTSYSADQTFITSAIPDTTAPTVSVTGPANGSTVGGPAVILSATATDDIAVAGVTFKVNGVAVASGDISSPYSIAWDSTATSSGAKSIIAVARDTSNNFATSSAISFTVDNTPPVISSIASTTAAATSTITWTTDEASDSKLVYGLTTSYGTVSSSTMRSTSHSIGVSGLSSNTTYHFAVVSADAIGNTSTSTDQTFTTVAALPSGALGVWYIDQYVSSPRSMIANALSATSTSANLFSAPRNLFSKTDWWTAVPATVVDFAATAPDGTSDASTFNGTGNWHLGVATSNTIPAGTYTVAVSVKRNAGTDQQFAFSKDNTSTRSSPFTATASWQRFSYTFTLGSPQSINRILLASIDGSTGANIQITDFELYVGSADLGPEGYGGHLYLGSSAYDTRATYASGALDVSANGYGLIQFPTDQTFNNITVQALVSKVATGSGYASILSKAQSYTALSAATEVSTAPFSYFSGATPVGPAQQSGLWVASGKGYHVITLRYDGTKFDYWLDDVRVLSNTVGLSPVTAADLFFNITNSNSLYGGNKFAGAIALWNRALSDTEIRNAATWQQARGANSSISATNAARIYVAEGDSITGAFSYSYPYLFGPNASPALYGVDYAISGSTLANLNSRAATIDGIIPPNKGSRKFILSVLIGANDLANYSGGYTQYAHDLAAYLDARRAAGWTVIVATVLPQSTGCPGSCTANTTFNTARDNLNPELRLWTTGGSIAPGIHADAIADFAANATMGCDTCGNSATYYADGEHPTAAGQAILETVIRPVINGL